MFILTATYDTRTNFTLKNYFNGDLTCYTQESDSASALNLGFCYANNGTQLNKCSNIVGESMVLHNMEVGNIIKSLKAKIVKTEYLEDGTVVIYCFTNLLNNKVKVDNRNINIQIAQKEDCTVVGWPLILGSF